MIEAARDQPVEHPLAGVAERRMTEIMAERDRLGQLFVQAKDLRDRARDLRDLETVREPRTVMVSGGREEDLRLVLQPPERLAVNDAVPIVLKCRAHVIFRFGSEASARVGALGSLRRKRLLLALLQRFTDARQQCPSGSWSHAPAARRRSYPQSSDRDPQTWHACRGPSPRGRAVP